MEVLEKVSKAISADYGIVVTFRGTDAETNGKNINLPFIPPELLTEENIDKLRGYCDHEIGHVLFSDNKMLESAWFKESPEALIAMTKIIEDIRIERSMASKYAGSRVNMEKLCLRMEKKVDRNNLLGALLLDGRRNVLGYKLETQDQSNILKAQLGEDVFQKIANLPSGPEGSKKAYELAKELLKINETREYKPGEGTDSDKEKGEGDGKSSDGKGERESKSSGDGTEDGEPSSGGDGSGEDGGEVKGSDKGSESGEGDGEEQEGDGGKSGSTAGLSSEKSGDAKGKGKSPGSENGKSGSPGAGQHSKGQGSMDSSNKEKKASRAEGNRDSESAGGDGAGCLPIDSKFESYIEKSVEELSKTSEKHLNSSNNYMTYSCSDDEFIPAPSSSSGISKFTRLKANLGNIGSVKSKVAALFNTRVAGHWENGKDNGRINSRVLAGVVSGRKDLFKKRWECRDSDTAITFLIDLSGSMNSNRKAQTAIETAILFSEILNGTKVKFEVLGFTTGNSIQGFDNARNQALNDYYHHRRSGNSVEASKAYKKYENFSRYGRVERLRTYHFKLFSEPYGSTAKKRFGGWEEIPMKNNCDGESVMIAFQRLMKRKEKRKILFVLSDGQPASYGNSDAQQKYLKHVTKNIEQKSPVELIGIGLMTNSVESYYKNHIIIRDPKKLPEFVLSNLKKILKVTE